MDMVQLNVMKPVVQPLDRNKIKVSCLETGGLFLCVKYCINGMYVLFYGKYDKIGVMLNRNMISEREGENEPI